MRTALVTGATGFIGRHVVAGLLDRGVAVRALVRSPAKAGHLACDGVERVAGSLADIDHWQEAIGGCDAVFHCAGLVAARRRAELTAVNGTAVGRLADVCAKVESPPVLGRRMARALGTFAIVLPLPLTVAVPTAFAIETYRNLRGQPSIVSPDKIREAVAPSWAASAARARRDLGFAPAATLDERLAETARWLRENGRL